MIINKEIRKKIESLSRKLSKLGYGTFEDMHKELLQRYVQKELSKMSNFNDLQEKTPDRSV